MDNKTTNILVMATLIGFTATQAQDNPESLSRLDEITVEGNQLYYVLPSETTDEYTMDAATVGTKVPASLRDIPQSVSIATQQNIRDRNVVTFDQLAAKTPGLRVLENDEGRSSVFARGYEYDEYNIDGLPAQMQSINGTMPSLIAFDHVEIMRGPSGLFDSSGEMGGIVNFVRKRPTEEFAGSAEIMAGNLQQYRATADIGGAFNQSGNVRGRVVAATNSKTPKASDGKNHTEVLYGALDIDLGESTLLGLGYLYQQRSLKPDNGLPVGADGNLLPLPNHDFYGSDWNDFSMHSHDFFADLKHDFANGGYGKIALRYSERSSEMNYTFARTALADDGSFTGVGLGGDVQQQAFALDASYSQPFETWGNISEYVVGVDAKHQNTDLQRGVSAFANMTLNSLHSLSYRNILATTQTAGRGYSYTQTTLDSAGVYGKLTLRPIQPLAVIAGGRLNYWEIESNNMVADTSQSRKENAQFTGYGGLVFDVDDNHSLYASYSSLHTPQTAIDSNGDILEARLGQQYEVGVKGSYLDDTLQARLSAFRLQDKNAAASVAGETYSAGIGKRTVKGIEAEINGNLSDNWNISAGYTYMETEVNQNSDRQEGIFLLMPRHSANIWSTYQLNDQWTIGAGVTAMSGFESSQGIKASGYATVDAMLGYQINDNMHAQLNVTNLLDRDYYKRVGSVGTFNMPGEGRTISATFRYDF